MRAQKTADTFLCGRLACGELCSSQDLPVSHIGKGPWVFFQPPWVSPAPVGGPPSCDRGTRNAEFKLINPQGRSSPWRFYDTQGEGLCSRLFCGIELFEIFVGILVERFDATFAAKTDQPAFVQGIDRFAHSA